MLGWQWVIPGQVYLSYERADEPELPECGSQQPGPAIGCLGRAEADGGPAQALLQEAESVLNGLIASDKFCWTRPGQLRLAWWRRPLRLR